MYDKNKSELDEEKLKNVSGGVIEYDQNEYPVSATKQKEIEYDQNEYPVS